MSDVYKIAVNLALTSNATQFFSAFTGQILGAEKLVKRLEGSIGSLNKTMLAIGGGAAIAAGAGILATYAKVANAGADLLDQQNQMVRLGRSQNDVLKSTSEYYDKIARQVPTASAVEYLKTVRELRAVTGDWSAAEKLAPQALKTDALLANISGAKGAAGYTEFYKLLRSAEMKGISTDPAKLAEYTDTVFSMIQAFGGKLSATDFQTLARRGGTAFIHTDIKKALGAVGVMAADLGGPTAGNALMSLYALQQGSATLSKQQYATLSEAGLIDPRRVIQQGFGKVQVKPGGIIGSFEHSGDLPGWAQQVLRPHLMALARAEAAHDHHPEQVDAYYGSLMAKIIPNRKAAQAAQMFSDPGFVDQRLKDLGLAGEGLGINSAYKSFAANDPKAIKAGFDKQYESMMSAIGAPLMQAAIPVMKAVTTMFTDIGAWANSHPDTVKKIGEGFAFLGAALIGAGGLALMAAIGAGGWLVIGLGALGAAFKAFAPKQFDEWLDGFKKVAHGIVTFNWKEVAEGIGKEISAAFHLLPDLVQSAIVDAVKGIGKIFTDSLKWMRGFLPGASKTNPDGSPNTEALGPELQAFHGNSMQRSLLTMASYGGANDNNAKVLAGTIAGGITAQNVIVLGGAGGLGGGFGGGGGLAGSGSWRGGMMPIGSGTGIGHVASQQDRAAFIRAYAARIGIDPNTALRVAQSEGFYSYTGDHGMSFGDFQMYTGGGLGNKALAAGINVRDPHQWMRADAFALNWARTHGWADWHGAAHVGIGNHQGIGVHTAVAPPFRKPKETHIHELHVDGKRMASVVTKHRVADGRFPTSVGGPDTHGHFTNPGTPINDAA